MRTSLRIEGANCPTCSNETLDDLARLDGVRAVHGSTAGPCIEIDHDDVAPAVRSAVEAIDPSMTLGQIVTRHPALAGELERRGLDYCCHGARTLEAAAAEAGLDARAVAAELSAARVLEPPALWASLGPVDLVDHIEAVHHRSLWAELPRISALVEKIVGVHGERHPELLDVQRLFTELRADLEPHLAREEQVLFPAIRHLAAPGRTGGGTDGLDGPIGALLAEHETVGSLLEELRRVTDGYAVPADGCATFAASYRALAELEADTHLHVHKENNVLFPALHPGATPRPIPPAAP